MILGVGMRLEISSRLAINRIAYGIAVHTRLRGPKYLVSPSYLLVPIQARSPSPDATRDSSALHCPTP